jgi:hypothetical protein
VLMVHHPDALDEVRVACRRLFEWGVQPIPG